MTVNLTETLHTETPPVKSGLRTLAVGWFFSKFLFENKTYFHPFIFLMFRYCINITKRIVCIQFKESFRAMFLYIKRLEGQVHAHRQKMTIYVCVHIYYYYRYVCVCIYTCTHSCVCVAIICTQTHNGYSMQI